GTSHGHSPASRPRPSRPTLKEDDDYYAYVDEPKDHKDDNYAYANEPKDDDNRTKPAANDDGAAAGDEQ
ncbi:hypothetical protein H0H92_003490, partial [Tricholoma furcatifolium]